MTRCWYEDFEERPCFDELAAELEKVLSTMVGYVELNMELVAITEDEHSKQQDAHRAFTPCMGGSRYLDRVELRIFTKKKVICRLSYSAANHNIFLAWLIIIIIVHAQQ